MLYVEIYIYTYIYFTYILQNSIKNNVSIAVQRASEIKKVSCIYSYFLQQNAILKCFFKIFM